MRLFVNYTIIITIMAAGIFLVKWILGKKITPRGHMLMWLLIGILMVAMPLADLLPALPEAEWSLRSYLPQVTETRKYMQDITPYIDDGIPLNEIEMRENTVSIKVPVRKEHVEKTILSTEKTAEHRDICIMIVWCCGSVGTMTALVLSAFCQHKQRKNLTECREGAAAGIFEEMRTAMGIRSPIILKTGAECTMLAGLYRPAVYLAADISFTEAELRHVFVHELTHYKHRDLWLNVIAAAFLCVYWWNPVFWLAVRRLHLDMEMYCDYDAANLTGDRQAYARTLVKAAAGTQHRLLMAASLVEAESQVSRRVKALAKFKKPKLWVSVLGMGVLLAACLGLAVSPAEEQPQIYPENVEFLRLNLQNSQGENVTLIVDEQKDAFLAAVNGEWREPNVWRNVELIKGDARDAVWAYLKNKAEPVASFQLNSLSELLSSHYPTTQGSSVKLYSWRDFSPGMVVLERYGEKVYISDSTELWNRLMDIIGDLTVMREVTFGSSAKEINWINQDGVLHQKDFNREESAKALEDYLHNLPNGIGLKLDNAEIISYLKENQFDYWVDLGAVQGNHKLIGHMAEDADGEGRTVVIAVNVGSGYVYDDPRLASLLEEVMRAELLQEKTE